MAKYYTYRLKEFLDELSKNNNREWFSAHKSEYEDLRALWLNDVQNMLNAMGEWEPALKTASAKDAAYRIYRDTRFSMDKTPYKTYFSASVSPYGRKMEHRGGYYLHMSMVPGDAGLYGGIWQPEAPVLRKLRHAIVDNIEEFEAIINSPAMVKFFPGWASDSLKTAPKGWPKDHPNIELLRLKDYGKMYSPSDKFFFDPSWHKKAADLFSYLKPLVDFINYSIDE